MARVLESDEGIRRLVYAIKTNLPTAKTLAIRLSAYIKDRQLNSFAGVCFPNGIQKA